MKVGGEVKAVAAGKDRGAFCMQLQVMEFMAKQERRMRRGRLSKPVGVSLKMKEEVQGFKRLPMEVKRMPKEAVVDGCGVCMVGKAM